MKKLIFLLVILLFPFSTIKAQKRVIAVETNSSGLYFTVNDQGEVFQQHFGGLLPTPEDLLLDFDNNTSDTHNVEGDAYPVFGNGNLNEPALLATHADGNRTTRLIYDNHTVHQIASGITLTEIVLKDPAYPFFVTLRFRAYAAQDVIECSARIHHEEPGEVRLERMASAYLFLHSHAYWLTHFHGAWSYEMRMSETQLSNGIKVIDSKRGVRATQGENPSFLLSLDQQLDENCGRVILGALAWSGNFKLGFQVDNLNNLHILAGPNDFASEYTLPSGHELILPDFIVTYSTRGAGQASRNMHRWARQHALRDGNNLRPVVFNSWEGTHFSFNEELILHMIRDAATMGAEIFVLDDGWFGDKYPRNGANAGLGDWTIDTCKLPHGLTPLIRCAAENGIGFGIWVEPEMVNPRSNLAEKHPEWIVRSPNREPMLMRNQLLLDLTNPEVQKFVYNTVADLLRKNPGIGYVKWDANRHVEDFGSSYLERNEQNHFWIDYVEALYRIYEQLGRDFPNVLFQVCASGGGRVDYGSLRRNHEFWASDNTDALSRLYINWGTNYIYPPMAVASHVSKSPNNQTGHLSPLKFRFDVSMAQRLGIELQPKELTDEELKWARNAVEAYKQIRPLVQHGDQYRLISPYDEERAALMYVNAERSKAVLFAYIIGFHYREDYPRIRLQGLDPDKRYRLREIMPATSLNPKSGKQVSRPAFAAEGESFGGAFLMEYGIRLKIRKSYESAVFEITEIQ